MRNITLAIDDDTLALGRDYANEIGMSFNAMVRRLIEMQVKRQDKQQWLNETLQILNNAHGNSHGKKWTREDLYER
jgi:hypothetical protein